MTYSSGGLIQATDYNTFVGNTTAGLNRVWSTGSGDAGWGQPTIATASTGGTVTATQWATLVNSLSSSGTQTGTTLTSRSAPTAGTTISILANVTTDITSVTTNRGNAAASGTEYGVFTGTTSKTTGTGSGQTAWTITFTHTITFPSADQARYFWNAGGIVRIKYGKSSTGTDADPDWNQLAGQCGSINLTGRVNGATQTIAAQAYTGTTRLSGTGGTQTTLATTTGWYNLTTSPATIFQLNDAVSPYSTNFIRTQATATSSTVLTLVTVWSDDGTSGAGTTANISGGTGVASPATAIGVATAPTTLVTYIPPSTASLTNTWGTPSIAASVA
ncbi:hypothetical protein [Haliscomenobacter sp.]|uniref:hypothetical protein n=1 Tax=Haliscomenobacter sp. TaxID=2717303 RepID=UPI0033651355